MTYLALPHDVNADLGVCHMTAISFGICVAEEIGQLEREASTLLEELYRLSGCIRRRRQVLKCENSGNSNNLLSLLNESAGQSFAAGAARALGKAMSDMPKS